MTGAQLIGYGRVRNDPEDFREQFTRLLELGVAEENIYWDRGRTGGFTAQEGLSQALAACHIGDTLVVTALDRLSTSLESLEEITPQIVDHEIKLNIGGVVFDPANEAGRSVFDTFLMVADCQAELALQNEQDTREQFLNAADRPLA